MTANWAIRIADENDLDQIMRIENECFASDAWSIENMHDELVGAERFYVVAYSTIAEDPDRLIGYAGLAKSPLVSQGDVQTIAVTPTSRGIGLGRALMNALLAEAKRAKLQDIFLEVRADIRQRRISILLLVSNKSIFASAITNQMMSMRLLCD